MKKMLFLVPTAVCLALTLPMNGHQESGRTATDPDSTVADTVMWDDSYSEDSDWAGTDDSVAVDSMAPEDGSDDFCMPEDELLSEYSAKTADYSFQKSKNANLSITFSATIFTPDTDGKSEVKKGSGYAQMVSRVLSASLADDEYAKWKDDNIDKMLENRWKMEKTRLTQEDEESGSNSNVCSFSYRTTITPVWAWKDKGVTTYCVEDEAINEGYSNQLYKYYLSFSEKGDSLLGLTDIFKESAIPNVLRLVDEKLKAQSDYDADSLSDRYANGYFARSGYAVQYNGKWYPRPALTECGVVFTYLIDADSSHQGVMANILLDSVETQGWLK